MTPPIPKPCQRACGQDVVLVRLPSGVWRAVSVVPVAYAMIHPDLPAVAWRRDGSLVDAHTAAHAPRLAYPAHLCPKYQRKRRPRLLLESIDEWVLQAAPLPAGVPSAAAS